MTEQDPQPTLEDYLAKFDELPNDEIAARIKSYRESMGFTQREFAKATGMSQSYLAQMETGRSRVTHTRLMPFFENLPISWKWLLVGEGSPHLFHELDRRSRIRQLISHWHLTRELPVALRISDEWLDRIHDKELRSRGALLMALESLLKNPLPNPSVPLSTYLMEQMSQNNFAEHESWSTSPDPYLYPEPTESAPSAFVSTTDNMPPTGSPRMMSSKQGSDALPDEPFLNREPSFVSSGAPPAQIVQQPKRTPQKEANPQPSPRATPHQGADPKLLGAGTLGVITKEFDPLLRRFVACKRLNIRVAPPSYVKKLEREALILATLEHPNIIPIYSLGHEEGRPIYTMRLYEGGTLEAILHQQAEGTNETSQFVLIQMLQSICMALQYAHDKKVIHCDVKPQNIVIGNYGEAFLSDFGSAQLLKPDEASVKINITQPDLTIPYAAPELLKTDLASPASDQYALGVILYRILAKEFPIEHRERTKFSMMFEIVDGNFPTPSERSPHLTIAPELEAICVRMLAREPSKRFASCREVAQALQNYLDFHTQREQRQKQSRQLVAKAQAAIQEWAQLTEQVKKARDLFLRQQIEVRKHPHLPYDDEVKRSARSNWRSFQELNQQQGKRASEIEHDYIRALEYDPGSQDAQGGLQAFYWELYLHAEKRQEQEKMRWYENKLLQLQEADAQSQQTNRANQLKGQGSVFVSCQIQPKQALLTSFHHEEGEALFHTKSQDGTLLLKQPTTLISGSYLLSLKAPGYIDVHCPFVLERDDELHLTIEMYPEASIDKSFVHIPAGPFYYNVNSYGNAKEAVSRPHLTDFFISIFPVTFGDYFEYLNELHQNAPEEAVSRLPQSTSTQVFFLEQPESHTYYVPRYNKLCDELKNERGEPLFPEEEGHHYNVPIMSISYDDAMDYCRWLSAKHGRTYDLPTAAQWEKAARGADMRSYPWGDGFDPSLCKVRHSRKPKDLLAIEPIGQEQFSVDQSVYGVRDLIGAIAEFTHTVTFDGKQRDPSQQPTQKGAGFAASDPQVCEISSATFVAPDYRSFNRGFRLVWNPNDESEK